MLYYNLSSIQDQAQLSSSNHLEMAKIKKWLLKSNHFEISVLLFKNRVWVGKTRMIPNAIKIELESYDIDLWRILDQRIYWMMWVHFGHPY